MSSAAASTFDPFHPQRKQRFLIEWRPTANGALLAALGKGQDYLKKTPSATASLLSFPQSCAADNQHATLVEFKVVTPKQLAIAKQVLQDFSATRIPQIVKEMTSPTAAAAAAAPSSKATTQQQKEVINKNDDDTVDERKKHSQQHDSASSSSPPVAISPGLRDFKGSVLFAHGASPFLSRVYVELHQVLHAAGLLASPKPQRDLVIHLTLGRLEKGNNSDAVLQQLLSDEYFFTAFRGLSDVGSICFCCRRFGAETTPPKIFDLFPLSANN